MPGVCQAQPVLVGSAARHRACHRMRSGARAGAFLIGSLQISRSILTNIRAADLCVMRFPLDTSRVERAIYNLRSPDVFPSVLYPGKKNCLTSRRFDVIMARLTLWQVACMLAGAVAGNIVSGDFSASSPTPPHIQDSPPPVGRNFQWQHQHTGKFSAGGKGAEAIATGFGGQTQGKPLPAQSKSGSWPPPEG